MATIKDVAQAAQVSAAAVSRVLNKDDNISVTPEVRARIFQAATPWAMCRPGSGGRRNTRPTWSSGGGLADHPSGPAQRAVVLSVLPGADDDGPV